MGRKVLYFTVYNAYPHFCVSLCTLYMGLLCPWYMIIIPMYNTMCNAHPYFSLNNSDRESVRHTLQSMVDGEISQRPVLYKSMF